MDKFEFMTMIAEIYEGCKTKEEIDGIYKQMIAIIETQCELSKRYLELNIL